MRRIIALGIILAVGSCLTVRAQENMQGEDGNQKVPQKPKYVPKDRITSTEYKLSNERIARIKAVVKKYYDRHANLESRDVQNEIKKEIQKFVPIRPAKKPDARPLFAIRDSLVGKVNEKYGLTPEQIRQNAEKEAEVKFPLAKRNEEVKVYYKRGRSILSVSGRFYGFGLGGKSVKLNSRNVPMFDMLPESKSLFDKKFNAEMRKNFIDEKVQNYMKERLQYSETLFAAEYAKIRKNNEQLGYIYQGSVWEPTEKVFNSALAEMIKKARIRAELERLEREAKEKAKREAGGGGEENKQNNEEETDE